MLFDFEMMQQFYSEFLKKLHIVRKFVKKPLTYTEKILYTHLAMPLKEPALRGKSYVDFNPDRVSMQDATGQMALLQFVLSAKKSTAVPTSVHCDHLIVAREGAEKDLESSIKESKEVYEFLESISKKFKIDFWEPGAGIIHQVVLENYNFPGGMMIGTDSHTPNGGGLGMIAIGVGGADAVDVMAGMPWEVRFPKIIGVHLKGVLSGWLSSKDVILKVAEVLTVSGGTGAIIEYFGEGAESISCTGKATICNMGAEVGATTSIFPYDNRMKDYLIATGREKIASLCEEIKEELTLDREILLDPSRFYDQIIEIDLSSMEPQINGPYTPDRCWKISNMKKAVEKHNFPDEIKVALIGSCTNSSYEDIERAASIAKQAIDAGISIRCPLKVTPGSEQVRATVERDGLLSLLEKIGAEVLANACGPCIGQWQRSDVIYGEKNTILTSYNRNFSGRNDSNPGTHSFVTSPELVVAMALSGSMSFNPLKDALYNDRGEPFLLQPPSGKELPSDGFIGTGFGYHPPAQDGEDVAILVSPESKRLQLLTPFLPRDRNDIIDHLVLVKVSGKCTTDHISPAGKWLKYRGHLDAISDNMFSGAVNAFRDEVGSGKNICTDAIEPFSTIAREYKRRGIGWIVIGDANYGEGSSREHAAMEPRYLGCSAIIVRSFARIHETNLKKQGILALVFQDPADYDKIREDDYISILGLKHFTPERPLTVIIEHADGIREEIIVEHTYNENQIEWFFSGGALNLIRENHKG